jgi:hypothetical protein
MEPIGNEAVSLAVLLRILEPFKNKMLGHITAIIKTPTIPGPQSNPLKPKRKKGKKDESCSPAATSENISAAVIVIKGIDRGIVCDDIKEDLKSQGITAFEVSSMTQSVFFFYNII